MVVATVPGGAVGIAPAAPLSIMDLIELKTTGFTERDLPRYQLMDTGVVSLLAEFWRRFGVKPLVTSSYRTTAENVAAGGAPESQHLLGRAVDFVLPGVAFRDVVNFADQIGAPGFSVQYPSGAFHLDDRQATHKARWGEKVEAGGKSFSYALSDVLALLEMPAKLLQTKTGSMLFVVGMAAVGLVVYLAVNR